MAKQNISYIVDGNGSAVDGAEIIRVYQLEKRTELNPFLSLYATAIKSTPTDTGGQRYRFQDILGYEEAEQSDNKSSNNTIDFVSGMSVEETILDVEQPFWSPKKGTMRTFVGQDADMLNGLSFYELASGKTINTLIKKEIKLTKLAFFTTAGAAANPDFRVIDGAAATTALEAVTLLKNISSHYEDITVDNSDWVTNPSGITDIEKAPAIKYFDAHVGSFDAENVEIHLHPTMITKLSDVNTEAGAGSAAQFVEFTKGSLTEINGYTVVKNKHIPKDKALFALKGENLLAPDPAVQKTVIMVKKFEGLTEIGVNGLTYFATKTRIAPLVTIVSLTGLTLSKIKIVKKAPQVKAPEVKEPEVKEPKN